MVRRLSAQYIDAMCPHSIPLLLLLTGCPNGTHSGDSRSLPPGSGPRDSDSGLVDTGDSAYSRPDWPPYRSEASWTSGDRGYCTGGAWADIDGDGALDLVVAYGNDMEAGPLAVHLDMGGELNEYADWKTPADAYHGHVAVGDVNNDGWTDVVTAIFIGPVGFEEPGGVALYLNQGGSLPDEPDWQSADGFYCFSAALGDVDNDGDLDLAVATGEPYYHDPEPDRLFVNHDGAFSDPSSWESEEDSWSMDVVFLDANDDGALDLAFARMDEPHAIYLNQGSDLDAGLPETTRSIEVPGEGFEGNTIDFGDVDGDGWVDLVVSDNSQLGGTGTVSLYTGPDFERAWESADEPAYQSAVALVDLDDDGDLDLAAGAWWGALRLYRNNDGLQAEPGWRSDSEVPVMEAWTAPRPTSRWSRGQGPSSPSLAHARCCPPARKAPWERGSSAPPPTATSRSPAD